MLPNYALFGLEMCDSFSAHFNLPFVIYIYIYFFFLIHKCKIFFTKLQKGIESPEDMTVYGNLFGLQYKKNKVI